MIKLPILTMRNQRTSAVSTHGGGSNDVQSTLWNVPNRRAAAIFVALLVLTAINSYFPAQLAFFFTLGDLLDNGDHICLVPPLPVDASVFYRAQVSTFPLPVEFHRLLPTHALAHSTATIQSDERHLMHHLHKLLRNRKVVFFQPVDVIAVEAGAWTTGHDEFPHTMLPVKYK